MEVHGGYVSDRMCRPTPFNQAELNNPLRDLDLPKASAELFGSGLKKTFGIGFHLYVSDPRQVGFAVFREGQSAYPYCDNVKELNTYVGCKYKAED